MPMQFNEDAQIVGVPTCDMEGCEERALVLAINKIWCGKCLMKVKESHAKWVINEAKKQVREENEQKI